MSQGLCESDVEETALDMSDDDKTIEIDLVDVNTNYPNLFLWAGSEAATVNLLNAMTVVRVQSIDANFSTSRAGCATA